MATGKNPVRDIYLNVVNDVVDGVREAFLDDGMDELVLQELKQLWESKLANCKAVDRAPPPQPEPAVAISPMRGHQAVPAPQLVHPAMAQFQQPGATAIQPQLMRLQATNQAAGSVYGNIPQLTSSAQIAASSLPAAFIRQLVNYGQGQNAGLVLQGIHSTAVAPAASVAPTDVGRGLTNKHVIQLDGLGDSSSEDDDHDDDDDDDDDDDPNDVDEDANNEEEDPLNSGDDVSDADPTEVFDAENVVVCQFEKINRCKNRWKFHLKDGIMNLNGRDYLFQKANGDAEW